MARIRFALALIFFCLLALPAAAQPAPTGQWLAEDILGSDVLDRVQTTIEFTGDGRVTGRSGCNRYFAGVKIEGDKMRFGQAGITRMVCISAVMVQETKFFKALEAVRSWRIDAPTRELILSDEKGTAVLRFVRMP